MTPRHALALVVILLPAMVNADETAYSSLGGGGIWTMPSARTAPAGSLTLGGHYTSPDVHIPLFYQPTEHLELGFRYSQRQPRDGQQRHNYDPQLDIKWRWQEDACYCPGGA
ncbi:hypothetical protein HLB35_01390 [Halomonas sp. TBZ9]|uniref:Uncharacterized protein n=1 Tax=Vreelandella azerica TaxID=2732867 RepID=A0A7Y3TV88_9GAMM|nr:YjbH domain-containing protein [Halomonas azerica]NOG30758.1 hypothetical protein [Halomonas azerica]